MAKNIPHSAGYRRLARRYWRTRVKRILIAGVLILIPAAITVNILFLIFRTLDGLFQPLVTQVFGRPLPGLGVLLTILLVILLGWLSTNVGGRRFIAAFEDVINHIPVARSIYGATKGILEAVSRDQADAFKRVVLVEYPKSNIFAVGFVTRGARWGGLDPRTEDVIFVFVPTTPNPTSGFLLVVPREEAIDVDITVEEGIRMVISGGILLPDTPDLEGIEVQVPEADPDDPDATVVTTPPLGAGARARE